MKSDLQLQKMTNEELIQLYNESENPSRKKEILSAILLKNDSLVLHVANSKFHTYCTRHFEDLCQEGREVMILCIPKFDPQKGKFSTFIMPHLVEAMKNYICRLHGVTPYYAAQMKRYRKAVNELTDEGNINPTEGDIAKKMNTSAGAVHQIVTLLHSINAVPLEEETDIASPYHTAPDHICEEHDKTQTLIESLKQLPDEERQVVYEYFLRYTTPQSVAAVAKRLRMKTYMVRRILNRAMCRLQESYQLREIASGPVNLLEEYGKTLEIQFSVPSSLINDSIEIALSLD